MENNDLISRSDAINAVSSLIPSLTTPDGAGNYDNVIFSAQEMCVDALQALHKLPAVDAVLVVRCCDCKYGEFDLIDQGYLEPPACEGMLCHKHNIKMDFIGFCSYGERKEPTNE